MAKPFEVHTPDDIKYLALRVVLRVSEDEEQNPVTNYDYNVDYTVCDENGAPLNNYDGDIEDELTTGEKTQLAVIIDRLVSVGRARHIP